MPICSNRSGKTLAMILSAIIHILHQPPAESEDGPIGVILASTPEMAEQIRQQANDLCQEAGIKCTVLAESAHQPNNHTKQCEVGHLLIATPDCLYDSLREKLISLPRCSYFALYEANQMIDVCLEEEITQIASQIRPECQRLIWSSSWNGDLKELAMNILNDYVRLDVGSSAVKISVAQNVKQIIKMSEEKNKKSVFHEIVDTIELQIGDRKTLVFTETPKKADKVARILLKRGFQSKSLHNGKVAMEQDHILSAFQNGDVQYLVLTDLAAKNLIFGGISNIIHFDMPISISDYALRINRTGRSDEIGNSYAILTEEDGHLADDLIGILQQTNQSIDPALFILKAANVDSDDEVSFAIPKGKGFKMYTIDNTQK